MATYKLLASLDLSKNELQNVVLQNLGVEPSNPKEGAMFFNTTAEGKHYFAFYQNGDWVRYYTTAETDKLLADLNTSLDGKKEDKFTPGVSLDMVEAPSGRILNVKLADNPAAILGEDDTLVLTPATGAVLVADRIVKERSAETEISNKTIDADKNTIKNLDAQNLRAGKIDLDAGETTAQAKFMSSALIGTKLAALDTKLDNAKEDKFTLDDSLEMSEARKLGVDVSYVDTLEGTLKNKSIDLGMGAEGGKNVLTNATGTIFADASIALGTVVKAETKAEAVLPSVAKVTEMITSGTPDASETVKGLVMLATTAEAIAGTDDTKAVTCKKMHDAIEANIKGAVTYKGAFETQAQLEAFEPIHVGDLFVANAKCTVGSKHFNAGDWAIFRQAAPEGTTLTGAEFDVIDATDEEDIVRLDAEQTLKNKTLDLSAGAAGSGNNVITNAKANIFANGVVDKLDSESLDSLQLMSKGAIESAITAADTRVDDITIEIVGSGKTSFIQNKDDGLTVEKFNESVFQMADTEEDKDATKLATAGYVDQEITALEARSLHKFVVTNPELAVSGGNATWEISHGFDPDVISVVLKEVATGAVCYADVSCTSTNVVINMNAEGDTVAAGTYKVVIAGFAPVTE